MLILEYVPDLQQFMVMQRIEIPKGEYTLDNAVNSIIEMNDIYNPSWIFCDRGYGGQIFYIIFLWLLRYSIGNIIFENFLRKDITNERMDIKSRRII